MTNRAIAMLCASLICSVARGGPIDRIEPPFWWQGFENN